ncbi:hypothetical protein GCM10025883_16510 [Mobilicoccus caccae]|uniref:Ketopantoate reductase N-terminal domain-containing protein n=1 Tax=Mobilicoccus caccae TaxID=1859295 RepID=A0ABQ6IQ80_9MICO|nr:hypothetical protein GCM10025883_16510 [Mobilicoccus caccae]
MTSEISTVAVLGAGAMGAMYADHFSTGGLSTCLVASGLRADRLRNPGLTVNGRRLDVPVITPSTSDSPSTSSSWRSRATTWTRPWTTWLRSSATAR